jgi:hypothetical protein
MLRSQTRFYTHCMNISLVSVSRDSVVGIPTSYELDDREVRVPLHFVQTGSGVHPTYYPMGTGVSFPGDKAVGA